MLQPSIQCLISRVIRQQMITAHNPWSHATTSDRNFAAFLLHPNSIRNGLPISQEASEVISRILAFIPSARLSLADMYDQILQINNFFMSDAEIGEGSEIVKEIVAQAQAQADFQDQSHTDADIVIHVKETRVPESSGSVPELGYAGQRGGPSSASDSTGPVTPNTRPYPSARSADKVPTQNKEAGSSSVLVVDSSISYDVTRHEDPARHLACDVPPAPRGPRHQNPHLGHAKKPKRQIGRSFSMELTEMLESLLLPEA